MKTPITNDKKIIRSIWICNILIAIGFALLLGGCFNTKEAHADSIVEVAVGELGKGEISGDNKGAEVKKYTKGQEVAWCAAFVSYVRSRSGDKSNYLLSAKSYWEIYKEKRVKNPKPGDIICFYRGSRSGNRGHVGIVEKVDDKYVYTIEGNKGAYPAKVKRLRYEKDNIPKLLGYVRTKGEINETM